jgi:tetrahydromethanopterin S-methyltransferase subunit F
MTQLFLITQSEELSGSIERYFRFRGGVEVKTIVPPLLPRSVNRLGKLQWVPETFRKIASAIETHSAQTTGLSSGLLKAICLVDVPDLIEFDDLDPIDRTKGWTGVVAMLILAFPEIHWAIISPVNPTQKLPNAEELSRFHFLPVKNLFESVERILTLHDEGFTALFDPTGLRQAIRERLVGRPSSSYIPLRRNCAVSIDEEEAYSYFHAYAAYRFGYRCHVITSYGLMKEILSENNKAGTDFELSFEDIYLNFPDRRTSLSKIEIRDATFPAMGMIRNRIFVTSGHQNTKTEKEVTEANTKYSAHLTANQIYNTILYKPESGVFDIWERSGMKERLENFAGQAPDFVWPPSMIENDVPAGGTHSAPGRLLVVAESLIARANRIFSGVQSVSEAVYGATLAMNAQEYLGLRTPTTALESISLKHRFEVLAECMFYGVEYHLDTKSRFEEIEEEMECVGVWFREETRDVSKLNTEIGMLSELVLIYRDFNQFNEEQSSLTKLRHVYRGLWVKRHKPWSYLLFPFRWYFDQLLASVPRFILALLAWILIFATVNCFSHTPESKPIHEWRIFHGIKDSIITFFGMQPPHEIVDLSNWGQWVTIVIIIVGFVHLGIFISHVYALISRR